MDKRKNYYLILDTETANTSKVNNKLDIHNGLVYDIGYQIIDKKGIAYEQGSYIIGEVFFQPHLMETAYYGNKVPSYLQDIQDGTRKITNIWNVRQRLYLLNQQYNTTAIVAHNAYFDISVLNSTVRQLSNGRINYFFPYNTKVYDTLLMARQIYGKEKGYKKYCEMNGYITKNGQPRFTAEILYRYLTGLEDFEENHTGLEDVMIEAVIFKNLMKKHRSFKKEIFKR